jgi:hypothetical protein
VYLEPDLADDEAASTNDEYGRQIRQVPVDIGVFLFVVWRPG